ncbi:MAG TPA: hypothetical protein VJA87_01125 [Candidatus Paceibacterota bacterium]
MSFEKPKTTPEGGVEKITAAAIRCEGVIFSGSTHADAFLALKEKSPEWNWDEHTLEDGFVTSSGRFVSREEASQIAKNANQLDHLSRAKKKYASEILGSKNVKNLGQK